MSHDVSLSVSTDFDSQDSNPHDQSLSPVSDLLSESRPMNQKIPFEVVNSNETVEVAETPVAEVTLEVPEIMEGGLDVDQTELVDNAVVTMEIGDDAEALTAIEAPAKKLKPKKLKVVSVVESTHETSAFEEFNLIPAVVAAIEAAGYFIPTPIQTETIPHVLQGDDIIGQAETGSGKTAAFACPLLSKLDMNINAPQVLVLTPTRELAIQVTVAFQKYGANIPGFRAVTIYGGQSYETQFNAIRRGVQVVVGTPGRVMDHLRQGTLDLSNLTTFVLDEGDEMLRMGFIDDVEWILEQLPAKRQILLFSATMPAPIQRIAQKHLKKPVTIAIKSDTATADSIKQTCVLIQPRAKLDTLAQILESEETDGVIVFVKTRNATVQVADQLSQRGFSAAPLNGEIPQNQRERTITHLKSGRLNVLVATDVAARGLDVQRVSHVVNYDFPHDTEAYIHRIGRTGRAGRPGSAILFVEPKEQGKLKRLQRETNQRIDAFKQKSLKEINAQRVEKFKQQITDRLADPAQLSLFAEIVQEYQRETETPLEQVCAALAMLAQGETQLLLTEAVNNRSNWKEDRKEGTGQRFDGEMATFRIEVGRNHGVGPGNIVGAITNEANLDNASIGKIKLFDDFSTIDLPASLPNHILEALQSVVVSGRPLQISKDRSPNSRMTSPRRKGNDGSTKFATRKPAGSGYSSEKRSFDKPAFEKKSYDKPAFEKKSYDKPSFEKKSYDKPAFEKKSYDKPAFEKKTYDKPAFEKKSYDKPAFEKKSYDKPAYEKKSFDKPFFEKKSFGKKPYEGKSSFATGGSEWKKPAAPEASAGSADAEGYRGKGGKKPFGKKAATPSPFRGAAGRNSSAPKSSLARPATGPGFGKETTSGVDRGASKSPMRKFVKIRTSK